MTREEMMAEARVLLVGLDRDATEIFATILTHAGFSVQALDEPQRVVEVAITTRPRLVVTNFPVFATPGVTVTQLLRADPRTSEVPILNTATHVLPHDLAAAAEAGVTMSLSLPAPLSNVVAEARRLIDGARSAN